MYLRVNVTDAEFEDWLASGLSEDELRDTYVALEAKRAELWTPGHTESFRRDRYERDAFYVGRLVQVKRALARHWEITGQFGDRTDRIPA
jgi:hypothetical protein